ncbi:hypothetical protein MPER_12546 [Moniliophthora perniciosa FA553]|nr:hypothetical protein MPER_12546 [Moniliophthora perniciosa FA553]
MGDLPADKEGWQGIVYEQSSLSVRVEHFFAGRRKILTIGMMESGFLYWDHLITFGDEVKHVWAHPKSRSSFLFLFLRYFGLTTNISVLILAKLPLSHDLQSLQSLSTDPPRVLLTLRIYALFNCDKRILIFLCGSAVLLLGMAAEKVRYPIEIGCHIGVSRQTALGVWTALFAVINVPRWGDVFLRDGHGHSFKHLDVSSIWTLYAWGPFVFCKLCISDLDVSTNAQLARKRGHRYLH